MPTELVVLGEHLQCTRHPETVAGWSQDVLASGQIVEGYNEKDVPVAQCSARSNATRTVGDFPTEQLVVRSNSEVSWSVFGIQVYGLPKVQCFFLISYGSGIVVIAWWRLFVLNYNTISWVWPTPCHAVMEIFYILTKKEESGKSNIRPRSWKILEPFEKIVINSTLFWSMV